MLFIKQEGITFNNGLLYLFGRTHNILSEPWILRGLVFYSYAYLDEVGTILSLPKTVLHYNIHECFGLSYSIHGHEKENFKLCEKGICSLREDSTGNENMSHKIVLALGKKTFGSVRSDRLSL